MYYQKMFFEQIHVVHHRSFVSKSGTMKFVRSYMATFIVYLYSFFIFFVLS